MNPVVMVYSQPGCKPCWAVKRYLDEREIPYEDINVQEEPDTGEWLVERAKGAGLPLSTPFVSYEDKFFQGFDVGALNEVVESHKPVAV